MRCLTQWCQLVCCLGFICFPVACYSQRPLSSAEDPASIRYGENGVPNFIKGANLSAPLDRDPAFRNLKAEKRYADIALYYLNWKRTLFQLKSPYREFLVAGVQVDGLGQKHVRLAQVFHAIPVWGKELRVHLNKENQVFYVHGAYQPILADLETTAGLSGEAAAALALLSKPQPDQWQIERIDTCIWAPDSITQRLAYIVKISKGAVYGQSCFVDAIDGSILHRISETMEIRLKP